MRSSLAPEAARTAAARPCASARSSGAMSAETASRTMEWVNWSGSPGSRIVIAASRSAAVAASSTASPAMAAASARLAPSPRTATARTRSVAEADAAKSRSSTAWAIAAGPRWYTTSAPSASVASCCSSTSRSTASRKNGLPPVASRHAAANSSATRFPSRCAHIVAVPPALSEPGRTTVVSGPPANRARSGLTTSRPRVDAMTATASPSSRGAR